VKALVKMAEDHGVDPLVLRAVEERNFHQKRVLPEKIFQLFGADLTGVTIGVWGLSFKPGTDDMREASSMVLIHDLISRNARVQAYDPVAMPVARSVFPDEWFNTKKLQLVEHQYAALQDADALVLVTEWKPFCYPDLIAMKKLMRRQLILDGRNQYDPKQMKEAEFEYYGIGRGGL
jgi:UDPglucose 6-dehydrogenase